MSLISGRNLQISQFKTDFSVTLGPAGQNSLYLEERLMSLSRGVLSSYITSVKRPFLISAHPVLSLETRAFYISAAQKNTVVTQ